MKKAFLGLLALFLCFFLVGQSSANRPEKDSDVLTAPVTNSGPDFAKKPKLVAGGIVRADGSLGKTWRVESCTITNTYGTQYEIKLKGPAKNYFYLDFITIVTTKGLNAVYASTNSVMNKLLVRLFDANGNPTTDDFQFLVYKL